MNVATGLLGGVSAGFSTYNSMSRLQTPSSRIGPGTPGGRLGGNVLGQISNYMDS